MPAGAVALVVESLNQSRGKIFIHFIRSVKERHVYNFDQIKKNKNENEGESVLSKY